MASDNIIVSSLPAYVQENRDLLLKNFGLVGTATRRRVSLQTGIKNKAYLNYLDVSPTLQSAATCGYNAAGDITLSQRTIEVAAIKVNMDLCAKNLIGKYAEYLVRINAQEGDCPFERYIIDGLVAEINKKIEKLIWQGDKSASTNPDIKWIDGWLEQFGDDASVIDVSIASGKSAYEGLQSVYLAMPEETLERGAVIFVSPAIYRTFLQEMVALNFFHYAGPQDSAPEEFVLPGTDVKVVKTPGLAGSLQVVGTFADNLVYGTDMENDDEDIKVFYDEKDEQFNFKVEWATGVSYYFPDQVVLGEFAAAPTIAITANNAALAAIATNTANIKDYTTVLGNIKGDLDTVAAKSAGLDNLAGIKTGTDNLAGVKTAAEKLAGAVNASDQIETHPNS